MQMMGLSMANIGHIFISHNHGDHVFGLPGLIGTMDLLGRTAELHIHGPQQVGELLDFLQHIYYAEIGYEIIFHPIDTRQHELIYEDRSITVHSIPLEHRIPSVGFLFREKPGLPHIDLRQILFSAAGTKTAASGFPVDFSGGVSYNKLRKQSFANKEIPEAGTYAYPFLP